MCTSAKMIRMGICMIDRAFIFYEARIALHSLEIKTISSPMRETWSNKAYESKQ